MKKLFYLSVIGFVLFEVANVFFIMPLPGSQEMNSLGLGYFLYKSRWVFRVLLVAMAIVGLKTAFDASRIRTCIALLIAGVMAYGMNFELAANAMFHDIENKKMVALAQNQVDPGRIVLGVEFGGEARAYPIQLLSYHHQLMDSIGGKPILVTYCNVCRSGRVYEPLVEGAPTAFRLVGMDHYNAMFEDKRTKTWWRQVTGEAVIGPLKGQVLPEMPYTQTTLAKWSELYPHTLVMQPDPVFKEAYEGLANYEAGLEERRLTRRDKASWQDKSWVVGVEHGTASKAFDWNQLHVKRILHEEIAGQPIALFLSQDSRSFTVVERNDMAQQFDLVNDTLQSGALRFNFLGKSLQPGVPDLKRLMAYQEYWHSWRTFHPMTTK
jgi:hypothetical protein